MVAFTILTAFLAVSVHAGDHPAVKIIALLEKLQAQVKEEGATEAADYAKFQYWCTDTQKKKQKIIDDMDERITMADAEIMSLSEDIAVLEEEISDLDTELNEDRAAKTEASTDRTTANGKYLTAKSDLQNTIIAVGKAITALEGASFSQLHAAMEQAYVLIELYSGTQQQTEARSFLQKQAPAVDEIESDMADTYDNRTGRVRQYDFKSGGIIETLKQLKTKFEDDLIQLNKDEADAQNAWQLADEAKQDEIQAAVRSKSSKNTEKGRKGVKLSSSTTTRGESINSKAGASSALTSTKNECQTKADEWADRSQRRAGEIEAMSAAVEVLKKVTHVRTPEDKGVQLSYTGFIQIENPQTKIVNLLRQAAKKSKAAQLTKLAEKIAALSAQTPGSGTFDQIKNMIEKMIFQLMAEQKDEDDHKNWCDLEIAKTDKMKTDKESRRDMLNTDIGVLNGDINQLTTDINTNTGDIADMESQIETQTQQRAADKAENAATVKDAQDAQNAVDAAIVILTDFYKSTGEVAKEAWEAFVQEDSKPSTWASNSPYTGVTGGSGVIDMLENIAADFASMEAEAKADETSQQDTYDRWMTATAADKAAAESDSQMKTSRRSSMQDKLQGKESDRDHNAKELDAVYQYETDLNKPCLGGSVSYTDRKNARSAEITALRQAQDILDDAFNGE